jgi:hypothetical protein
MIRSILAVCGLVALLIFGVSLVSAGNDCATIPSGQIHTTAGVVITPGYADSGYNYQAHMFNGLWGTDNLVMRWNDAWLSNQDCDGDGLLDRHYGYSSYIGSGAWLTNHFTGSYMQEGQVCEWDYFVKIIAVPANATLTNGVWYNVDGTEIGAVIWNEFAIIQEVSNDLCAGFEGIQYSSPDHNGLGGW